jgi:uncharacterized protein YukE
MAELSMQTGVARTQAGVLDDSAQKIKKAKSEIDSLIGELKSSWWGDDQKKFDTKWNGQYAADLTKASTGLSKAADQIRTEAKQQDQTSH